MIEMIILIGSGICGLVFDWGKISGSPVTNIVGGALIVLALAFHSWAEKDHKQAHEKSAG
jgi:predicted MFS family arabinose efflux permease